MTILDKSKARIVKTIIPQAIIVIVSIISLLGIFINICTTLLFGLGENYTSLKQLVVCAILAVISLYIGLGRKVTVSMTLNTIDKSNCTIEEIETVIFNKNKTSRYNITSDNTKCIYEKESKNITLIFKDRTKLMITDNCVDIIDALNKCNIAIKTI